LLLLPCWFVFVCLLFFCCFLFRSNITVKCDILPIYFHLARFLIHYLFTTLKKKGTPISNVLRVCTEWNLVTEAPFWGAQWISHYSACTQTPSFPSGLVQGLVLQDYILWFNKTVTILTKSLVISENHTHFLRSHGGCLAQCRVSLATCRAFIDSSPVINYALVNNSSCPLATSVKFSGITHAYSSADDCKNSWKELLRIRANCGGHTVMNEVITTEWVLSLYQKK